MKAQARKLMVQLTVKYLKMICGMRWVHCVRNVFFREVCGSERNVIERADKDVLKLFQHIEVNNEDQYMR